MKHWPDNHWTPRHFVTTHWLTEAAPEPEAVSFGVTVVMLRMLSHTVTRLVAQRPTVDPCVLRHDKRVVRLVAKVSDENA